MTQNHDQARTGLRAKKKQKNILLLSVAILARCTGITPKNAPAEQSGILKNMKNKEFYTAKELAEMLSLNVMTIYRYIDAGKLKAYKIGKEFRIEKSEFERFMNKAKTK